MPLQDKVQTLIDCVRVSEAATILGVTTKTLRNWDRNGKLIARRHPVNGYRIYLRDQLEDLINRRPDTSEGDSDE